MANFVFPYIYSVLPYLHCMMLVHVKLDIGGYKRITFQGCRLHQSSSFQNWQNWQYWHLFACEKLYWV